MVMRLHRDTTNRVLAVATLVVLVGAAGVLLMVERRYNRVLTDAVDSTVRSFEASNALGAPDDVRVDFAALAELVRRARDYSPLIRDVYVVKRVVEPGGARRVLVHPWEVAARRADWETRVAGFDARPVARAGEVAGVLHLDLDRGLLSGIQAAIAATIGLIVATLFALVARIFLQQRALTATEQVLQENQRELIRLERLALAGQLSANVFHDVRKPVTNIKHELTDLSEALGGFAGATRALKSMKDQTRLFFDILRDSDIERFIRAEDADEEFVDVNRIVEQALRLVQYERGSTQLSIVLGPELPLVLAYPWRMIQVVSNLILNAYQALEGHGEIRIETRLAAPKETARIPGPGKGSADPGAVCIEISDNGPGIPPDAAARVFSPFFTTKPAEKGTGLGLYIARMIVERLEGDLRLEKSASGGVKAVVVLPGAE